MQGWSPDFIPKLTGDAVETGVIDRILRIANADGCVGAASWRRRRGSLSTSPRVPPSPGHCVCADAAKGSTILCMLPDTGERYLSTPLFADIPTDMTEEEVQISHSTPSSWLPPPA